MVSPSSRLMKLVSNRINSVELFSIFIIILLLEDWIDSILPVYVCVVV